jgi:3-oxoacyl-[acyl-carrier protein] reductase
VALDLAGRGWSVAICYRTSRREAEDTRAAIMRQGSQALAIPCDVSDPAAAEALVRQVEQAWGRVDALINGAGPYHRVNLLDETAEGWRSMFANNLDPVFYLAKAAAPGMKARKWGRIVSFAMANADQQIAQPMVTAHYISKAGILILTRSLAKLLAPHGITVNAISPGFVASGSAPESELQSVLKNIPAGSVGSLDDAVAAVRFLLSDEARYVNGGNIHLSGGWGI